METRTEMPSVTEKHNAMISYCFLALFMLFSPREEFKNTFVRSHSRYAALIHLWFLLVIIFLVYSRNFSSVIIYDFSWMHAGLFIIFFWLLVLLWNGLYSAFMWEKPRMNMTSLSLKNLEKEFSKEVTVSEEEKTLILLSHIPFFGIYLSAKYGGKTEDGEKFGTWLFIALMVAMTIDRSLVIFIMLLIVAIFWLVYQSIGDGKTGKIHLLGDRLLGGREVHLILKSLLRYIRDIFNHTSIPSFGKIYEDYKSLYENKKREKCSPFLFIPLINILFIIRLWKKTEFKFTLIQGILISIISIYAVITGGMMLGMLSIMAWFWWYTQSIFDKNTDIPVLSECSEIFIKIIEWKKNKSISEQTHFPTHT